MPSAARSAVYRGTRASREIGLGDLTMACRPLDTIATRSLGANGTGGDLSHIRSCRPLRDHPGRAELEVIFSLIRSCRSEWRLVGKEMVSTIRSRWLQNHK